MTTHLGFLYRLEWHNPYTEPPDSKPRLLAEMFVPTDGSAHVPAELVALHRPGSGYVVTIQAVVPPPTERSPEQKAATRQKRLARRMEQRYPLFAEEFTATAIDQKPDYYLEGQSDWDASRADLISNEWAEIDRLTTHANTLIVYGEIP